MAGAHGVGDRRGPSLRGDTLGVTERSLSKTERRRPAKEDDTAPSGVALLAFFAILGLACIGGYFLLMKLIDVSRQEDCMLGGRRNCVPPIEIGR
jgi:hypothetical protein